MSGVSTGEVSPVSSYKPGLSETNLASGPSVLRLKRGNWNKKKRKNIWG